MNLLSDMSVEGMILKYTPNGGAERTLGQTEKGSKLSIKKGKVEIKTDETGDTVVKRFRNGAGGTIQVNLATSTVANIALAAGAELTTVVGPPAKTSYDISPVAGGAYPFGKLVLHPISLASNDVSRDWTFFRVEPDEDMDLEYTLSKGLYVPLQFTVTLDQDAVTGKVRVACLGDITTGTYFTLPGV